MRQRHETESSGFPTMWGKIVAVPEVQESVLEPAEGAEVMTSLTMAEPEAHAFRFDAYLKARISQSYLILPERSIRKHWRILTSLLIPRSS